MLSKIEQRNREEVLLRSRQLRPYIVDFKVPKELKNPNHPESFKISIAPPAPLGHSPKPIGVNRILLSNVFFSKLGDVLRKPTSISEITEKPEESHFANNLRDGRLFQFIQQGIFSIIPKELKPKEGDPFWNQYQDALLISILLLNKPEDSYRCRVDGTSSIVITYYFRQLSVAAKNGIHTRA